MTMAWAKYARQIDDINSHDLTSEQLLTLQLVSLCVGALSVTSVLLASYWIVRMRRTFRHVCAIEYPYLAMNRVFLTPSRLVMLLMQSDMLKAVCFMVYPIVEITHGVVASGTPFCQTSGFFLTLGMETCDFAVLLIAVHTVLCVSRQGSGIYAYRLFAFSLLATVPLTLSVLAFINKPAFANSGEFCYLPMQPLWTRKALSWIPRYIIFATLLIAYAWVYIYIIFHHRRFNEASYGSRSAGNGAAQTHENQQRITSVPPLPEIQRHGLVPTPESSSHGDSPENDIRRWSTASATGLGSSRRPSYMTETILTTTKRVAGVIRWRIPDFGRDIAQSDARSDRQSGSHDLLATSSETRHTPPSPQPTRVYQISRQNGQIQQASRDAHGKTSIGTHPSVSRSRASKTAVGASNQTGYFGMSSPSLSVTSRSQGAFWNQSLAQISVQHSEQASMVDIFTILRRGPQNSSPQISRNIVLSSADVDTPGTLETRDAVRRQARQLLVYPLVYTAVWLIPFISHMLGEERGKASFSLILATLVSLSIQGVADAVTFSLQEKPWRSYREDEAVAQLRETRDSRRTNAGRNREEMRADWRVARRRLKGEIEQHKLKQLERRPKPRSDWWDFERTGRSLSSGIHRGT